MVRPAGLGGHLAALCRTLSQGVPPAAAGFGECQQTGGFLSIGYIFSLRRMELWRRLILNHHDCARYMLGTHPLRFYCCEAFEDLILVDPLKRFSSLPLFIRFGMLRNFFLP